MKTELHLAEEFGSHLADGPKAALFSSDKIEPLLAVPGEIVLDFTEVRNANSSFTNALISGLLEKHGDAVLDRLLFKGCNPNIKVLVQSAINLGLHKSSLKAAA
jgi:hypothetical protein